MKKYYLLLLQVGAIFCFTQHACAFDNKNTHSEITGAAIGQSKLKTTDYLKNNLGFTNGKDEEIAPNPVDTNKQISIEQVIKNGAVTEDTGTDAGVWNCSRGFNHLYDPTKGTGFNEPRDFSSLVKAGTSLVAGPYHGETRGDVVDKVEKRWSQ